MKLALKHPDLVTEDHKLDVLVRLAAPGRDYERTGPGTARGTKGEGHGP